MESTALPKIPLIASPPTLRPHRRFPLRPRSGPSFAKTRCLRNLNAPCSADPLSFSFAGSILRGPPAPASRFLSCISSSGSKGDGLGATGGGGGGDGGSSGGEAVTAALAGGSEAALALDSDSIILSVGGMSCGGCAASVKRILESQPQVSSATVNLEKETAFVWVVSEVKVTQNWQQQLGEMLANHLTTCGFKSKLQDSAAP